MLACSACGMITKAERGIAAAVVALVGDGWKRTAPSPCVRFRTLVVQAGGTEEHGRGFLVALASSPPTRWAPPVVFRCADRIDRRETPSVVRQRDGFELRRGMRWSRAVETGNSR